MKRTISSKSSCDCGVRITGTPIYAQVFDLLQLGALRDGLLAPEPFEFQRAVQFRARSLRTALCRVQVGAVHPNRPRRLWSIKPRDRRDRRQSRDRAAVIELGSERVSIAPSREIDLPKNKPSYLLPSSWVELIKLNEPESLTAQAARLARGRRDRLQSEFLHYP